MKPVIILSILVAALCLLKITDSKIKRLLTLERLVLNFFNSSYGNLSIAVGKYNRTAFAMNCSLHLKKNFTQSIRIKVKIFKYDSGLYKETAIQINRNLCDFLDKEYKIIYGPYTDDGYLKNFWKTCPIEQGHYFFYNAGIPEKYMPIIPPWQVKTSVKLIENDINVVDLDTYSGYQDIVV